MKKRVGILTLYHGSCNYGGLLQAYALRHKIEELGFNCELIDFVFKKKDVVWWWKKFIRMNVVRAFAAVRKKISLYFYKRHNKLFRDNIILRQQKCRDFREIIPHSPTYTAETIKGACERYDYYVAGSDQIWNSGVYNDTFLLSFVSEGQRKIAYAASLGTIGISTKDINYFRDKLSSFHSVSMRELGAAEVIKDIVKRETPTVLDPVLLFDSDFWDTVAAPSGIDEPYALVYIPTPNKWLMEEITAYCKNKGLRMVSFPHLLERFTKLDLEYYDIHSYGGPRDFISLIRNAQHIFTTSFHGTAFSCVYHKNFTVFIPNDRQAIPLHYLRTGSLLSQLGLEERAYPLGVFPETDKLKAPVDWGRVDEIRNKLKGLSLAFLKDSLR